MSRAMKARSVATLLPASGRPAAVGAVLADVGEHLRLGVGSRVIPCVELVEQARGLVHRPHEVAHLGQRLARRLDDQVDALADDVEVEVGDQGRDLDQGVGPQVETRHLTVDPDEALVHEWSPYHRRSPALPQTWLRTSRLGCRPCVSERRLGGLGTLRHGVALVIRGHRFIWASWHKLTDPYSNVASVRAYDLLPEPWPKYVGYLLPVVEVLVGVCLVARPDHPGDRGVRRRDDGRPSSSASSRSGPTASRSTAAASAREAPSPGAKDRYPWDIARDVGFFLMAGLPDRCGRGPSTPSTTCSSGSTPERILDGRRSPLSNPRRAHGRADEGAAAQGAACAS